MATKLQERARLDSPIVKALDELGYYVPPDNLPPSTQRFHKVPFTIATIGGLVIHNLLSAHPRQNLYTDLEWIWYPGAPTQEMTENDRENALREYVIMQMIDAHPGQSIIYDRVHDNLRIAEFSHAFSSQETAYDSQMTSLCAGYEQIIAHEHHLIKTTRWPRNGDLVEKFLDVCEQDDATGYIAETVRKKLQDIL